MQVVELAYSELPELDPAAIAGRAAAILGGPVDLSAGSDGATSQLWHKSLATEFADGTRLPPATVLIPRDEALDPESCAAEVRQSWSFPEAAERVRGVGGTLVVSELMASGIAALDRLRLFHGVLQATLEQASPRAVICRHSQQVIDPQHYLETVGEDPFLRPGSMNVRMFRVEDSDATVMDTRGLDAIGLHDAQIHYRDLDPNQVAHALHNLAFYLVDQGAVIESGHTVPGLTPDSHWKCDFQESILEPKREILDLDPGAPFAPD
jgi:hypothetical protein